MTNMTALYDDTLEFESDELGLLELDWKDVKQLREHRIYSARFEGAITIDGNLRITEESVFISIGDQTIVNTHRFWR